MTIDHDICCLHTMCFAYVSYEGLFLYRFSICKIITRIKAGNVMLEDI